MKQTLYDFCLESGNAHLLVEWDTAENLPHTPQTISFGSSKPMGWVCPQGHRWQAVVKSRTAGRLPPLRRAVQTKIPECAGDRTQIKNAPTGAFFDSLSEDSHC